MVRSEIRGFAVGAGCEHLRVRTDEHVAPPAPATRSWLPQWGLLAVLWGSSFLFMKVALQTLVPLQIAFGRVALGALFLLAVTALGRMRLPTDRRTWLDVGVVAVFQHTIPFTLFAWGETRISSVLAGIWNATTPLFAVLFGLAILPWEKVGRDKLIGLAVGFFGVLVVLGFWNVSAGGDVLGSLACVGATACYGIAVPYTRRRLTPRGLPVVPVITAQLLSASVQLGIVTLLFTSAPTSWPFNVTASMLGLGILGTGLAFILNYRIVRDAGTLAATSVTYVIPIVSTVLGVLVLGETLTWNEPVGAVIVLAGVALVQGMTHLNVRRSRAPA